MTGAPVPDGADAVVMVEDTEPIDDGTVRIRALGRRRRRGARRPATTSCSGETVLTGRHRSCARPTSACWPASGRSSVPVVPPARVGVLSHRRRAGRGRRPARAPARSASRNRTMLLALVAQAGAVPVDLGLVRDDEAAITAAVREAARRRATPSSPAAASAWATTTSSRSCSTASAEMRWMQIAIKPAKPFAFGLLAPADARAGVRAARQPGLVARVSFELLARPALRQMMGHPRIDRPEVVGRRRRRARRAGPTASSTSPRVHGRFGADGRVPRALRRARRAATSWRPPPPPTALAVLPDGDGVEPGGDVDVLLIGLL